MDFMDAMETSLSIADQQVLDRYLPQGREGGLGVIVKRPIANAVWRYWDGHQDADDYHKPYLHRLKQMDLRPEKVGFDGSFLEMALRFTCFTAGVSTAIVGSTNLDHMRDNQRILQQGPLPENVVKEIRKLWTVNDTGDWVGQG
jgi:aryl-alcohol dehydrogenase-like predicted oxidoreductase